MRRSTLIGAVLATAALAAHSSRCAQTAKVEDGVMAVPVVGLAFSLGYLADDLNLWEKHGVRIKTVQISGIGAMNAVIAGSADFTQSSGSAITRAAARGQKLVGIVGTINRPSVQIILRKDRGGRASIPRRPLEQRVKALRGRTIAVDAVNSVIHAYVRYLAKRSGFDPEEIRIAVLQPPNMLAALQTKQVDGFAMAPPWVQKPLLDGEAVMVASGPDGDPAELAPFANTLVATKPDTCAKRKALCEGVGRDLPRGGVRHARPPERGAGAAQEAVSAIRRSPARGRVRGYPQDHAARPAAQRGGVRESGAIQRRGRAAQARRDAKVLRWLLHRPVREVRSLPNPFVPAKQAV